MPEFDSRALWELLMLEGFQAGLAWIIVLRKRDAFRQAFRQFDPVKVAKFKEADVERLMQNPGIIRARAKIEATIQGARVFLEMKNAGIDFSNWAWGSRRRKAYPEHGARTCGVSALTHNVEGTEAARIQVRWAGDRLCVDAGGGNGQRSFG